MSEIREAVIISAVSTPVGKFLGSLKEFKATELGAIVVRESVKRAGVAPEDVDEVIMGCVIQAGLGQNPARQAALRGGLPPAVSAVTVNKVCGSGLESRDDGGAGNSTRRHRYRCGRRHGVDVERALPDPQGA